MRTHPQMRNDWRLSQPIGIGFYRFSIQYEAAPLTSSIPFAQASRELITHAQLS
jgi:hypothetical protein